MSLQGAALFDLDFFGSLPVVVESSEAPLTSDAGLLPMREFDAKIGLTAGIAAALAEYRNPLLVEHSIPEMVRSRETREPAGRAASFVANRMREAGILLGTDGPHHNVVKIRPPMPFDAADADRLVETFDGILAESFS